MNANELKAQIELHQASIQDRRKTLDEIREGIVTELKPLLKVELKRNVEREITDKPEHTKELGREKLSSMKQQLSDLLEKSDRLVEETFDDDALWIYTTLVGDEDEYLFYNIQNVTEKINSGIKTILGEAGRLLQLFGYIEIGSLYQWKNRARRSFDLTHNKDPQEKLIYMGHNEILISLQPLIDEYTRRVRSLYQELVDVSKLREDLSKQEASDLWDEA